MVREHPLVTACALSFLLAGCGGGGSGGNGAVAGLSVPSKMTVIDAQSSGAATAAAVQGSDYQTDETRLYVHDEALDALGTINEILASLAQTHYDDPTVVNQGPYLVLVAAENSQAGQGGGGGAGGGGQQGQPQGGKNDAPQLEAWVVDSSRASADAPHVVQFWIDTEEAAGPSSGVPARIYAKLTIHDGVSAEHPFGRFVLYFKELPRAAADTANDATLFHGTLETVDRQDGQLEYTFFVQKGNVQSSSLAPGEEAFLQEARVVSDAARTGGKAYTHVQHAMNQGSGTQSFEVEYHLAFNPSYVARRTVGQQVGIDVLDRHAYDTYIWRYGLYDATDESRVQRSSGFSFRTAQGEHGWVGYHGLWVPDEAQVSRGDEILRDPPPDGAPAEVYTVFSAPGRLVRRTRSSLTLGDMQGESLYSWDPAHQVSVQSHWDGASRHVWVDAVFDEPSGQWTPTSTPYALDDLFMPGAWISFWSAARGEVRVLWPTSGAAADTTRADIFEEVTVTGDAPELASGSLTLYAAYQAPKPLLSSADLGGQTANATPFFPDAQTVGEVKAYVLDAHTMTLTYQGAPVRFADGVTLSESAPFYGGVSSGPLLAAPIADLTAFETATSSLRWDTGQHRWNQLWTVLDARGSFVHFDTPLGFTYTHHDAQDPDHDGRTYWLEYQGFGELHGLPYRQVSGSRQVPELNLKAGTQLQNASGTFLVKPLEGEQVLRAVANPQQVIADQGLDVDTTLTPPDHAWTDPAIGPKPAVGSAPRFIAGEPQS